MKRMLLALQIMLLDLKTALFTVLLLVVSLILLGSKLFELVYGEKNFDTLALLAEKDCYYVYSIPTSDDNKTPITVAGLSAIDGVSDAWSPSRATGYANVFYDPDCPLYGTWNPVTFINAENAVMENLGLNIIRGRNLRIGINENGHYEAVVSENLEPYCPIGSVFPIENTVHRNSGYQKLDGVPEVEIVGVISLSSKFLSLRGQPGLSNSFFDEVTENEYCVFAGYTDLNWNLCDCESAVFSFEPSLTEKERNAAFDEISAKYGSVYSCRELYRTLYAEYRDTVMDKIPECALLLMVVLLTVCGCSTMNILSYFPCYSLCMITGGTQRSVLGLIACMNLYIFGMAAAIGLPCFRIYMNATPSRQRIPCDNPTVIGILLLLYASVFFLSLVIPTILLKKNPVTLYLTNKN